MFLSAILLGCSSLTALNPFAYEGFNGYTTGGLANQTPQPPWIVDWGGHASLHTIATGNLTYQSLTVGAGNQRLVSTGAGTDIYCIIDGTVGGVFDLAGYIDTTGKVGKDGTTLYISFLFTQLAATTAGQNYLQLRNNTTAVYAFGHDWNNGFFRSTNYTPSAQRQNMGPLDTLTHMVVLKIEFLDPTPEVEDSTANVTIWFDPDVSQHESGNDSKKYVHPSQNTIMTFNQVYIKTQNQNWHFDELRFGTTFDDVAYSPAATPPAAPTNLVATPFNSEQINLTWTDNANNENDYYLESSSDGLLYTEVATLPLNTASYNHTNLTPNTLYYYRLSARNPAGPSSYATTSATTPPSSPPEAPSNLSITTINSTKIYLTWTDNASLETEYNIEISTDGSLFTPAATLPANSTSYLSHGLTPNQIYYYRVFASNINGPSGAVSGNATTMATDPAFAGAYEGFDIYAATPAANNRISDPNQIDPIPGVSGITLWTGENVWSANTVEVGNLTYSSLTVGASNKRLDAAQGGQVNWGLLDTSPQSILSNYIDPGTGLLGVPGKTIYISYLVQFRITETVAEAQTYIALASGATETFQVGQNYNARTELQAQGVTLPTPVANTDVHLAVIKIVFGAGADAVSFWWDPEYDVETAQAPTSTYNINVDFDRIRWKTQPSTPNLNAMSFDEIRLGETWAQVTPGLPAVPISKPTLAMNTLTNALGFPTVVGKQYQVLENAVSPNPADPNWVPVGSAFLGDGNEASVPIVLPTNGGKFFHVVYEE